ncbi:MAG: TVP38/TMEM64 family protein [Alphaproteobacteria bacterium]
MDRRIDGGNEGAATPGVERPAAIRRDRRPRVWWRLALVAGLLTGVAVFVGIGGHEVLNLRTLQRHSGDLVALAEARPVPSALVFVVLYAAVAGLSLPVGALMTVAAGLLFGPVLGTALAVVGATAGATLAFLAARHIVGPHASGRVEEALRRMDAGFRRNAFNYLLALRLMPLVPFWLLNLATAFAGVRVGTFVAATALGIMPATLVFALVGNGLGSLMATGTEASVSAVLRPEVLVAVAGLALLALLPVAYRKFAARGSGGGGR